MATPDVAESGDSGDAESPDVSGDVVEDEEEDVKMVQASVEDTGADPDGFFDDVDTESGGGSGDNIFDGTDEADSDSSDSAAETRASGLAADINRGAARLSVIGLDDEWQTDGGESKKKDDLKDEFQETFEAFRLGHYGSVVVEEYLLIERDDIHPVWGLVGAMLICAAVVVYRRPDGDQLVDTGKQKLGDVSLDDLRSED